MSLCKPHLWSAPAASRLVLGIVALAATFLPHAGLAQTNVLPGETVTLGAFDFSECVEQSEPYHYTIHFNGSDVEQQYNLPFVNCDVSLASAGKIRVRAGSGAFLAGPAEISAGGNNPLRDGFAIGRIGKTIRIPALDPDQIGSTVLAAQISTEVDWNGVLWNRRIFIPSWTQVVGTLQVRDLQTGLVVASNTFLNKRSDLANALPENFGGFISLVYGWTSVRNSSGVDLKALLVRGRQYRIEVETKCEDLSVLFPFIYSFKLFGGNPHNFGSLFGGGGCFFTEEDAVSDVPSVNNEVGGDALNLTLPVAALGALNMRFDVLGGFNVKPLTVTVQDDSKAKLAAIVNRDDDQDGIPNNVDACPNSILTPSVVIDSCNSNIVNTLFATGCTLSDEVAKCAQSAKNHGGFTGCVATLVNKLDLQTVDGVTGPANTGAIERCAAQARIP